MVIFGHEHPRDVWANRGSDSADHGHPAFFGDGRGRCFDVEYRNSFIDICMQYLSLLFYQ